MKVLLVGPDHPQGSLPPYLDVLTDQLRRLGVAVDRLGSPGVPYDPHRCDFLTAGEIVAVADRLATAVDPARYDVISVHFGNLEIEQLLVWRWWQRSGALPPVVVHVHALDPTLFTVHRPHARLRAAVDDTLAGADALVYFGHYAQVALGARVPATTRLPGRVVPLPTTIGAGIRPAAGPALTAALHPDADTTMVSLCGYAAPWKSAPDLLAALQLTRSRLRVVLAGPFWDDPAQAGTDLRPAVDRPLRLGHHAELVVVPAYLDPAARAALVAGSHAGVFPYRPQPTFQGSGAIADYLTAARPVIATDVANMAELAADAGVIVRAGDPAGLAAALDRYATDPAHRTRLVAAAAQRTHQFTAAGHAAACLDFYQQIERTTPCRLVS